MSLEEVIEYNKQHVHYDNPEYVVDPDRHKTDQSKWWWVYIPKLDAYGYIACHCKDDSGIVYIPTQLCDYKGRPTHKAYMYLVGSCAMETETI